MEDRRNVLTYSKRSRKKVQEFQDDIWSAPQRSKKKIPSGSGRDAVPDLPKDFQNHVWLQPHISFRKTSGWEDDDNSGDIGRDSPAECTIDSAEQSSVENPDPANRDEETSREEQSILESCKVPNKGKRPWSSHRKKATKTKDQVCPVEEALLKSLPIPWLNM